MPDKRAHFFTRFATPNAPPYYANAAEKCRFYGRVPQPSPRLRPLLAALPRLDKTTRFAVIQLCHCRLFVLGTVKPAGTQ
jgi:hypothetical protein